MSLVLLIVTDRRRVCYAFQQAHATLRNVSPSRFEIACVPRVGHLASSVRKVQEQVNLFIRIASTNGLHVSDVPGVHAYKQVETVVVVPRHLPCRFAFARDIVFCELPSSRRIHFVPNLFGRCGSRLDVEVPVSSSFVDKVFHHKLCHRAAANIAMTNEKNPYHTEFIL